MYVPVHNTVSWTNCLRTLILLVFISIERIGSGCYSFWFLLLGQFSGLPCPFMHGNKHIFGAVTVLLANCSNVHRHFHTHFCLSCPHRLAVAYIPETFMSPWSSSHDSLNRKHVMYGHNTVIFHPIPYGWFFVWDWISSWSWYACCNIIRETGKREMYSFLWSFRFNQYFRFNSFGSTSFFSCSVFPPLTSVTHFYAQIASKIKFIFQYLFIYIYILQ